MLCLDVNVLLYAAFEDSTQHERARDVIISATRTQDRLGVPSSIVAAFLRLATSRRVFTDPLSPLQAATFVDALLRWPQVVRLEPGPAHWRHFQDLIVQLDLRDHLIPDAWLAALAVEHSATLVSFDRDFARFPNLRWIDPTRP